MFTYTEKRRGRKETEVARRIKGGMKGERQIQPVISSLSVLHRLEHTEIHRVGWSREGLGRRHRRPGGEKGESKGRESSQASNLAP